MRAAVPFRHNLLATGLASAMLFGSVQAGLSNECKPHHFRAPFFIKSMGACAFDPETLSFAGTPVQQAMCLMRGMDATRNLGPPLQSLPPGLASRIGETTGLPSREALANFLSKQNLEADFAAHLWDPVSRANDNDPDAPMARYFVIHDTSGPNYGHRDFPADIDSGPGFEKLADYACSDGWGRAHVFVNRIGEMLVAHDYAIAWRETKFEQASRVRRRVAGSFPAQRADTAAQQRARPRAQRRDNRRIPPSRPHNMIGWLCSTPSPACAAATGSFRHSTPPSMPKFRMATTIRSISISTASPIASIASPKN